MAEAVEKVNLLGMTLPKMIEWFEAMGEKKFRAVQVMKWIHAHGVDDFEQMTDVSKKLREKLQRVAEIRPPEVIWQKDSADGTRKWVMRMDGGSAIETVFIPEDDRGTLCVSSQIGCALDCSFCSTGKQGFSRDLTTAEIIGQVWLAAKSFDKPGQPRERRVTNVVMMGMGEPLMNYRPVVDAMHLMLEDNAYGISKRRVTLSTSGVVPEIERLGDEIDVSLALSLHAPNDELRNKLVPLNRKYPLEQVLSTCREYLRKCGDSKKRVLTIEYTLMNQVNDELAHAEQMANLLREIPCKINLIPFNPFPNSGYERPSNNRIHRFRDRLTELGYNVTIRKTRGDDIDAACGQLAGQVQDRTRRQERFIKLVEAGGTAAERDFSKR
ncbi:23S rRNA (adenine(2503)-C(2))-methyltransferase RlmN [Salinibius halmophilus]|uniref:23S rRNA (adenine(2503)-C(2))-methyltransferase RlmN n=1 Tax=Salinibius halmophilus TaxID=1853216 RepID=UPI000E6702A3|nr:23S rRNA (adenine(2503)-C(2))-methyltransferase RlmN [Salinibius halmophilus]